MQELGLREWNPPSTLVTPRDDVAALLFQPALTRSSEYLRAVGYFSSSWIAANAAGLAQLAANGGRARWVTSPHLSDQDWEAIRRGSASYDELFIPAALTEVGALATLLQTETLNALSWMVHEGILEFKIALPRDTDQGFQDFHTKFGLFCDSRGPAVAFVGSLNESFHSLRNHEVISVFAASRPGDSERVDDFYSLFEAIWADNDDHYTVLPLPEAVKASIETLRNGPRPFPKIGAGIRRKLRAYQETALQAWIANGRRGIFEMATGTGKTMTAMACVEESLQLADAPSVVLIACPFQHLVDQWGDQITALGLPVVHAHESSAKWRPELYELLRSVDAGLDRGVVVITTYKTLTSHFLQSALGPTSERTVLIADECHYLGSSSSQEGMNANYPYRLGLSATPERHYDPGGTASISSYFDGVCFEYGMERAIAEGYLVPYTYEPEFVFLSDEESEEYTRLSLQLARMAASSGNRKFSEAAKHVAMRRARVINNAESKLAWLQSHLEATPARDWRHTLVYSGDRLFPQVTSLIGAGFGIRVHEFTARQSRNERRNLLERFESGDLQILAAMKCLDEGVDVPPTRTAFFLASSGNPREFIQRRGRILRPSVGKTEARVVDAIALPQPYSSGEGRNDAGWRTVRSALKSQLSRATEFARLALNRVAAEDALFEVRVKYDLPIGDDSSEDQAIERLATEPGDEA
jgi:superfamily II DNA or RNA helicase